MSYQHYKRIPPRPACIVCVMDDDERWKSAQMADAAKASLGKYGKAAKAALEKEANEYE